MNKISKKETGEDSKLKVVELTDNVIDGTLKG